MVSNRQAIALVFTQLKQAICQFSRKHFDCLLKPRLRHSEQQWWCLCRVGCNVETNIIVHVQLSDFAWMMLEAYDSVLVTWKFDMTNVGDKKCITHATTYAETVLPDFRSSAALLKDACIHEYNKKAGMVHHFFFVFTNACILQHGC